MGFAVLAGCPSQEIQRPTEYPVWARDDLIAELNTRARQVTSIKAKGKLKYQAAGMRHPEDCDMHVALKKPDLLRLQGWDLIGRQVLDLGTDGGMFWVWLHVGDVNEVHVGSLSTLEEHPGMGFLTPRTLFIGLGIGGLETDSPGAHLVMTGFPERYLIDHLVMKNGRFYKKSVLWIDRRDLTLSRYQVFDKEGTIQLEVKLGGYKDVEGIPIAHEFTMRWPQDDTLLGLELKKVELNPPLKEAFWHFKIPEDATVIDEDRRLSQTSPP